MKRPEVVEWLAAHGGIRAIHAVPFVSFRHLGASVDYGERVIDGWQNVYICMDGTRRGLSPAEEEKVGEHGDYLRYIKGADASQEPPLALLSNCFRCAWCGEIFESRSRCSAHSDTCESRPENRQ